MEIEVKFRVDSFDHIKKKLEGLGASFLGKYTEHDIYFTPFSEGETLRVRISEEGKLVTYKKLVPNKDTQSAIEIQAKADGDVEEILERTGHEKVIEKLKTREMYGLGNVTVNLDDVKDLGKFVELEYIGDQASGLHELKSVSEKLGLNWESRITTPYIRMLLQLKNKNN
jgi:adenylate cyclase class 2